MIFIHLRLSIQTINILAYGIEGEKNCLADWHVSELDRSLNPYAISVTDFATDDRKVTTNMQVSYNVLIALHDCRGPSPSRLCT